MSFNVELLLQKLKALTLAENSIQSLSLWMIHHKRHAASQVDVWMKRVKSVGCDKGLALFYLANEVIQNSKRKRHGSSSRNSVPSLVAPEIISAFKQVLPGAVRDFGERAEDACIIKVRRIIRIWQDRAVFRPEFIETLYGSLGTRSQSGTGLKRPKSQAKSPQTNKRKAIGEDRPVPAKSNEENEDDLSVSEGDMDVDPLPLEDVAKALMEAHQRSIKDQERSLTLTLAIRADAFDDVQLGKCTDTSQVRVLMTDASRTMDDLEKMKVLLDDEASFRRSLLQTVTRCLRDQKRRLQDIKKEKDTTQARIDMGRQFLGKSEKRLSSVPGPVPLPNLPKPFDLFGGPAL